MVNGLFKIRTWSQVHSYDQIVLIFWVKDEQTGLHICAKQICDRSRTCDIIDQKACRSYGEQDSNSLQPVRFIMPSPFPVNVLFYIINNNRACVYVRYT
jgi:hypothetical protein